MKRFIMGVVAYFIFAGTAFAAAPEVMTYQGRLKENGLPVTGDRDIIITLCDAPSAGTCHPAVPTAQTVHVSTGLFKSTFTLPSGTDLSTGEWYLQVNVDTVDLLPREKLAAVPYALYSSSAAYAENAASAVLRTGDTMTGGLLVSGSSLTVVAPDTIPASLWVSSSAATPHLFVSTAGLVGLGTDSPDRPLHIVSRSGQVGLQIDGYDASYDTIYIDSKGGGVPGYGYLRGGLLRAMTSLDGFENLNLEVNGVNRMTIRPDGRVGLNTAAPSYLLHVSTPAGETGTIMAVSTGASNVFWVDGTAAHALKFIGDGSGLTGVTGATGDDPSALKLSGGNMTGQLTTASTITVQGGAFSVGGSTLVVGNGAVGIGISVPTAAFQVNGDWIMGSGSDFPGGGVAGWLHSPSGVLYEGGGVAWSHHFAAYGGGDIVRFGVSAASGDTPDTRAVITNSGWLGVGPGVPGALLHVSSGAGESGTIMAVSTGATNLFWVTGGGAHASRFVGDGSGLTNLPVGAIGGVIPVSQGGTGLASIAPDNLIYASAADTFAAAPLSPFARTLLDDGTSVDARSTLGLVIGADVLAPAGDGSGLTGITPSNIAAGTLSPDVIASSLAVASVYEAAFLDPKVNRNGDTMTGSLFVQNARIDVKSDDTLTYSFAAGTGTVATHLYVSTSGSIGMGTTAPQAALDMIQPDPTGNGLDVTIAGNAAARRALHVAADGGATVALSVRGTGRVGLGTEVPQSRLDVVSGSITVRGTNAALVLSDSSRSLYPETDPSLGAGVSISTNIYVVGFSSATKYYGDGSALTDVTATDPNALPLAGGVMGGTLDMDGNFIAGVSTITILNGSISIVPPGTGGSNSGYGISIGSNAYNNYGAGIGAGYGARENRNSGVGIGNDAYNNYDGGVGVGPSASNNYTYGAGVGMSAGFNYTYGVGVGRDASNNHDYAVGVGYYAKDNYSYGVGVGNDASSNYNYGVGVGKQARNNNNYAVGVGAYSQDNADYGAALGAYSYAASSSVALGYGAKANAWNSVAIGSGTVNNSTGTASFGLLAVNTSSAVNAGYYQINGSTVLAVLPGTNSLGVGAGAGRLAAGNFNTFVGANAGYANTSGASNSFIGAGAGYANTTGSGNSFLGYGAGIANTGGHENSFVGQFAGYSNTTGEKNSFLGSNAGNYTQTGVYNTIAGYRAGYGNLGYSYSSSTIMGAEAGYSITTGGGNTLYGWRAGYNVTTGTGNIVIGYDQGTSASGASNELNIGGVLYGDLSAKELYIGSGANVSTITPYGFFGNGSGLTGISASDNTKLPLAGGTLTGNLALSASTMTVHATGSFARLLTAGLTNGATMVMYADLSGAALYTQNSHPLFLGVNMGEILTVAQGGKVGINTSVPSGALDVIGGARFLSGPATAYILTAGTAAMPDMFFISSGGVVGVGDFSSSPVSTDTLVNISPVLRPGDDIVVGLQVYARSDTGNAVVVAGEETGVVAANFEAEAGGDDTMENLAGLRAQIRREGAGGGAVQQAAAIWVDNFHHDGGGTTVNTYGLRISSLTVPGQTNAPYAIYSEDPGARTYFAGDLGISSVPAYALVVSSQTGDVLWVSSYAVHGMKFVGDGSGLTGVSAEDNTKLPLAGGSLSGQLTIDGATLDVATLTVKGDAFSVGISSSFAVKGGSVAIGIEPGWARLHLFGDNPDNGAFVMEQLGGGVAARILGSKTGTGNTAVSDGEAIFDIRYDGHDGGGNPETDWIEGAIFRGAVDGPVGDGVVPIGFEFHTSSATDADLHTRLAIRSDGRVQIGATSMHPALLEVRDYASQYPYLLALGTGTLSTQVLVSTTGSVGIGVQPSTESVLTAHYSHEFTAGGEEVALGIQASAYGYGTGDPEQDAVAGADFQALVHSEADIGYLVGLHTVIRRRDGTGSGTVNSAMGLFIDEFENSPPGSGGVINTYGIFIATMTAGDQTNEPYAIYSYDPGARTYFAGNVGISSATPSYALVVSSAAGSSDVMLAVSTGSSIVFGVKGNGEVYTAGRFIGDGSGLSNINVTGDGLGSHVATTTLLMGPYGINTSSSINAGVYQINGSTALAMPPGPANIAVGEGAGYANASGGYNLFAGDDSGHFTRTGSANTLLGYRAGYGTDGGSFSSSTVVGYEAGYFMGAGAEGNTLLGWRAGYGITSGTGNIVIGYDQGLPSGSDNNKLNIGGVLFGDLARRTIGISTRTPNAALDINSSTEAPFALLVSTAPDRPMLAVSTAGYVYVGGVHDSTITLMSVEARLGDPYPGQEDIRVALSGRVDTEGSGAEDVAAGGNFEVEIKDNDVLKTAVALRTAVEAGNLSQVDGVIGLFVERPENSGDIRQTFGVYIATQTALTGTQSQVYGLYSEDPVAYNYFGGRVGIGTKAPQAAMHVAAGDVLLDDDRTIAWGLVPAPYITGNDSSGLLAFGVGGAEKFKIQEPAVSVLNADLVISTTTGSRGIVFQDGSRQISAAPKTVLIYKPSDTTTTNDAVPDIDPHLQFYVDHDEIWEFEAVLYAHTDDTGFATDFQAGLTGPGFNLLRWDYSFYGADGVSQASGGVLNTYGNRPVDWTAGVIAPGTRLVIRGTIHCGAAGGPFGVVWSQSTAGPFITTVFAGSYLKAHKVQ